MEPRSGGRLSVDFRDGQPRRRRGRSCRSPGGRRQPRAEGGPVSRGRHRVGGDVRRGPTRSGRTLRRGQNRVEHGLLRWRQCGAPRLNLLHEPFDLRCGRGRRGRRRRRGCVGHRSPTFNPQGCADSAMTVPLDLWGVKPRITKVLGERPTRDQNSTWAHVVGVSATNPG